MNSQYFGETAALMIREYERQRELMHPTYLEAITREYDLIDRMRSAGTYQGISHHFPIEQMSMTAIESLKAQLTLEKTMYNSIPETMRSYLDQLESSRFAPLWEQVLAVSKAAGDLVGLYEPQKLVWQTLSERIESTNPNYSLAVNTLPGEAFPHISLKDYSESEGDETATIEIPTLKDIVGIPDLVGDVTQQEAVLFLNFLTKFPMLGLENRVGRRIFEEIADRPRLEQVGETLFRGRVWERNRNITFVEDEMFEPPFGMSRQGRFNPHGVSTLYFSNSIDGVRQEVSPVCGGRITILKATTIRDLRLIDLGTLSSHILDLCNKPTSASSQLQTEYIVPNFLAQCCKYHGIDGAVYTSVHSEEIKNYAFFNVFRDSFRVIDLIQENL